MSLHKDPELKEAILNLPQKEKDKLLVRLISKDKMLMKQLHYQILENEDDLEERIISLKGTLHEILSPSYSGIKNVAMYSNFKNLTILLRKTSALITEHEKVTKDKFSEVELRLQVLSDAFTHYPQLFKKDNLVVAMKLKKYTVTRISSTTARLDKLHEDLQFDLNEAMQFILDFAERNDLLDQ